MSNIYCSFTMKSDDVGATIEALLANQREARATIQYLRDENTRLLRELHAQDTGREIIRLLAEHMEDE